MNMIEKITREMIEGAYPRRDFQTNPHYSEQLAIFRPLARSALAALLKPSEDMRTTGWNAQAANDPTYVFTAMIQSALDGK